MEIYAPQCKHDGSELWKHLSAFTILYSSGHYKLLVPRCCLSWYLEHKYQICNEDKFWITVERSDNFS